MFIELKTIYENEILINTNQIVSVRPSVWVHKNGRKENITSIETRNDHGPYPIKVAEKYFEVKDKIQKAGNKR